MFRHILNKFEANIAYMSTLLFIIYTTISDRNPYLKNDTYNGI